MPAYVGVLSRGAYAAGVLLLGAGVPASRRNNSRRLAIENVRAGLDSKDELHVASFAKKVAAFFRISRSALAARPRAATDLSPAALASPGHAPERHNPDRRQTPSPICAARSYARRDRAPLVPPKHPLLTSFTASSLNSRLNFRLCIANLRLHETTQFRCPPNRQQLSCNFYPIHDVLRGFLP